MLPAVRAALVVAVIVALLAAGAAPARRAADDPFSGLATWVDIYDEPVYANPEGTAARIAARGVRTVFAETANYKAPADVVGAPALGSLRRRAARARHRGRRVVPARVRQARPRPAAYPRDAHLPHAGRRLVRRRRARRRGDGREARGRPHAPARQPRRARLHDRGGRHAGRGDHAAAADARAPPDRLAGASRGRRSPSLVDAFVPMAYTGSAFRGYEATYGYVARSLASLRAAIDAAGAETPIHAAGGVADRMTADELTGFVDAAIDAGVAPASASTTSRRHCRAAGRARSRVRRVARSSTATRARRGGGRSGPRPRSRAARGSGATSGPRA